MNNSKIYIDNVSLELDENEDLSPALRGQETNLTDIIEAIENIKSSSYWKVLEKKIFKGVLDSLQKKLKTESEPVNIYRLQGQIMWAEKYTDLDKLIDIYKLELQQVKKQLTKNN